MTDELPEPKDLNECDAMLEGARTMLAIQRTRGSIIGLHRIRVTIDRLLDHRNRLVGPPVCGSPDCGRVKDRYGTDVWLCSSCDMRDCGQVGCTRKVIALNHHFCGPCRGAA